MSVFPTEATGPILTVSELHDICKNRLQATQLRSASECTGDKKCWSEKVAYDVLHGCQPAYQSWLLEQWIRYIMEQTTRPQDAADMQLDGSSPVKGPEKRRYPWLRMEYIMVTRETCKTQFNIARRTMVPEEEEEPNVTTLALVEYVTNAEACRENREVRWNVFLAVYDDTNGQVAVLPMSQEACVGARELSWARIVGKKTAMVIHQMASSPYLSLLWLHTTLDFLAEKRQDTMERRDLRQFSLASVLQWDQCGFNGHFSYRVAMLDALLPREPQRRMLFHLDQYAKRRMERTKGLNFETYSPGSSTMMLDASGTGDGMGAAGASKTGEGGAMGGSAGNPEGTGLGGSD